MLSEKPRSALSETRKVTKSTMEKKRRARINNSLTELKTILSGMVSNKSERFDKMEKADILEMTVNCVRQLQRQSSTGEQLSPITTRDEDYTSGMHTCVSEVMKFLTTTPFSNSDPEVKTKLMDHLVSKFNGPASPQQTSPVSPVMPSQHIVTSLVPCQDIATSYDTATAHVISPNRVQPKSRNSSVSSVSSLKQHRHSPYGHFDSTVTSTDSVLDSGDSNNNKERVSDRNGGVLAVSDNSMIVNVNANPFTPSAQQISPLKSPVPSTLNQVQPLFQMPHTTNGLPVPTVPLTILVPANICSGALGTTCVIPLTFSGQNQSPQQILHQQVSNVDIAPAQATSPVISLSVNNGAFGGNEQPFVVAGVNISPNSNIPTDLSRPLRSSTTVSSTSTPVQFTQKQLTQPQNGQAVQIPTCVSVSHSTYAQKQATFSSPSGFMPFVGKPAVTLGISGDVSNSSVRSINCNAQTTEQSSTNKAALSNMNVGMAPTDRHMDDRRQQQVVDYGQKVWRPF